ncbi:DUF1642 domain-containing protein [Pediococcus pentosaceus]|uniref:DUF1642 domain-containing protein n=1 Tax=Pediococcus pentosaceus TaxID=1255 RepID=UPI00398B5805
MTKEEVLEKLKEERESAKSKILYGQSRNLSVKRYGWYFNGLDYAVDLAEKLDESKKVVIPHFVADWIREAAQPSNLATISVMYSDAIRYGKHIDWFKNHDNQRLLLKALLYGYEVEKESKYYVKIKCFVSSDNTLYVNHNNARGDFFLDNKKQSTSFNTTFTKSYLKSHWTGYDAYNNAGLLEFEEVEDE